jgi:hypothetical protein
MKIKEKSILNFHFFFLSLFISRKTEATKAITIKPKTKTIMDPLSKLISALVFLYIGFIYKTSNFVFGLNG